MRHLSLATLGFTLFAGLNVATADSITLKATARPVPGATSVTLADIAELEGPDAVALGSLVMAKVESNAVELPVRDVRARLDEAGANWGRINLNGRRVAIRPNRSADAAAPLAMAALALEGNDHAPSKPIAAAKKAELVAATMIDSPTLRGAIVNLIVAGLHCDPANLRLAFDVADDEFLNTPTDAARFEIAPLCNLNSDRIDIVIRTWEGSKVQQRRTISITPTMRVKASVLKNDIRMNQTISEADIDTAEQWLSPALAAQNPSRVAAVGRVAGKELKAGEMLRDASVHRGTLVKRGDQVMVRCLVGGVAISLQAEAKSDGAEGDSIELRKAGEKQTFLATITGRGEAVVDLSKK